jgi:hypothetical protein
MADRQDLLTSPGSMGETNTAMQTPITWPEGKDFAFTIFDDTDNQTLENGPAVYDFLTALGFRTTKSVWPLAGTDTPLVGGATCADAKYLEWVQDLQQRGFEIALHNVTYHTSARVETRAGLEHFRELFGTYPRAMANHCGCREAPYWADDRVSGINRLVYNVLSRYRFRGFSQGHRENSPLFWGDLCQAKIKYMRNFVFGNIDTLKACPFMPYHDPDRPLVNYWFAASEGGYPQSFVHTLSEANQDRLEAEHGACIMYTHLGDRFYYKGKLYAPFQSVMERLSRRNGWFVPVTTLLDYLLQVKGHHDITSWERARLERKWLWHKIRVGGTS